MIKNPPNWCIYSNADKRSLEKTLKNEYPFIGNISFYHPILDLYSKSRLSEKRLNHKYLVQQIGQIDTYINESSRIVDIKVEISKKKSISQWRKGFIKEIPLIPLNQTELLNRAKKNPLRQKLSNFLIFGNLYSIENSAYIEQLISFLCSNLVENKISIHFPYYYGSASGIFKTFTYSESNSVSIQKHTKTLPKNHKVIKRKNKYLIKMPKIPTNLLILENAGICLGDVLDNQEYCHQEWKAYVFQVIAALAIIQSRYNITHNDLHIGNVMIKNTKKKFIYYTLDDKLYFKIPTFGYIVKIVDWGRSLVSLKSRTLWNSCYNIDFDVFGQYFLPSENKSYSKEIKPNTSFDMTIFIYSLLNPDYDLPNDDLIKFLINICNLSNGVNIYKKYKDLTFDLYCEIAKYANRGVPSQLINHTIFKEFQVSKELIKNTDYYYPLS